MRQRGNNRVWKMGGWLACFLLIMLWTAVAVYADTGTLNVSLNSTETTCTVRWSDYQMPADGEALTVAVWSEKDGQDDLKWRELSRSNGVYSTQFSVSDHASTGQYQAHLYLRTKTKQMVFLAKKAFTVSSATCTSVEVKNQNDSAGTCKVVVSGISSPSGVTRVQIPTWCKSDQSDIVWYEARKQTDGTWAADIQFSRHANHKGTYQIHVYANSGNGIFNFIGKSTVTYPASTPTPAPVVSLSAQMQEKTCELKASGLSLEDGIERVYFIVWSSTDGQDDIKWNVASYNNGNASCTINLKEYCDFGTYNFHVYAISKNGKQIFMGKTTFEVPYPSAKDIAITINDKSFTVTVSGISCVSGIDRVVIPVWCKPDQSDLVWYRAAQQADGSYKVTSDISKHGNHTGTYNVHVYVYDDRDSYGFNVGRKTMTLPQEQESIRTAGDLKITASQDKTVLKADISSVQVPQAYEVLLMAVWSQNNGQDDLNWYYADDYKGSCSASIPLKNHKNEAGIYNLHLYARQADGTMLFVQKYTFEAAQGQGNTLTFENNNNGTVDVHVKYTADIKPTLVFFPTWIAADQSDLKWYSGTRQSDGTYKATIDVSNHGNRNGVYNVHNYYYDTSGVQRFACKATVELQRDSAPVTDTLGTGTITSCRITDGNTVTVTANVSGSGTFGLFRLSAGSGTLPAGASPLATVQGSGTITLKTPLNANTASSLINEKLIVAQKQGSGYVILGRGQYITNPEAIASITRAFPTTSTKKGLQVNPSMSEDAADLGVKHAVINIVLNNIPSESGGIPYDYNGKTWHMDKGYIFSLDKIFEEHASNGSVISAILLMQWNNDWSDLIIPSGRTPGHAFYGLNAETAEAREQLAAIFSFLAHRYSSSTYNVVNWILGNEVDDYTDFNWCGNIGLQEYAAYYAHAFRLLYNSTKSEYSNARVYISLDHVWNYPRSYGFKGMDLFNAFVAELQAEGDINWNIAFHPYPNPITSPNFWNNRQGVTNSSSSSIFTMLNLRSLTDYIKNTYGAQHRFILSEAGFTSWSNGKTDERLQAAAIAYGYYLAEFNDMVDNFVVHRHVDNTAETSMGLYLGLWNTDPSMTEYPTTKKFAWEVFKRMDTSEGPQYTNFALSVIGANSWEEIVPGYTAARFS